MSVMYVKMLKSMNCQSCKRVFRILRLSPFTLALWARSSLQMPA